MNAALTTLQALGFCWFAGALWAFLAVIGD